MLRELIDIAVLEDFVAGLGRAAEMCAAVYSVRGDLLAASPPGSRPPTTASVSPKLPDRLKLVNVLPATEPPAGVAFVQHDGLWTIVVPVHVKKSVAGFVGIGVFRDRKPQSPDAMRRPSTEWEALPILQRTGDARPVIVARWASRMLAEWCLHEARLADAAEHLSLLGDIGELLSGAQDLQTVLDRIVAETARVMNSQYCSLRLYDRKSDSLTIAAAYNLSKEYTNQPTVRRADNPIGDEALRGQLVYIEDATSDPRIRVPDEARRLGIVSGIAAPMLYRGEPVGVLRVYADHRKRFRSRHRNLLRAVASQAAIAVVNARLFDDRLRSATLQRQLRTAGHVQARMVRTPPPEHLMLESALVFEPSSHVGGDFCDIFNLGDGRLAAVVGDVVGHGVPAALLMASTRGALRASSRCIVDLAALIEQLNGHICRETTTSEFVTLLLVAVTPAADRLHFVSAGHEPLLLLRDGNILTADQGDLVLGLGSDQSFTEHTLDLHPGDFVLLYTDGVVEAMNFEGEMFGRDRLHQALRQYGNLPPDQALRNIRWDVRRFVGLAEQSDDLTMVGLHIRGHSRA